MSIQERVNEKGQTSYRVMIRRKNQEISKTFLDKEGATLFEYHRSKLTVDKENFAIPIKDRVRLIDIIELKIRRSNDERMKGELELSYRRVMENMKDHVFLNELTYEDWMECFQKISNLQVSVRNNSKKKAPFSLLSLRRIFASLSSAFSTAVFNGIPVENHPLNIIQKKINPAIKKSSTFSSNGSS